MSSRSDDADRGETKRVKAVVQGRVQGVNFRYHTRQKARELGLRGHVRNVPDGTVEVVAQGDEADVRAMLAWLERGPRMAHVSEVQVDWQSPVHDEQRFRVRY